MGDREERVRRIECVLDVMTASVVTVPGKRGACWSGSLVTSGLFSLWHSIGMCGEVVQDVRSEARGFRVTARAA
jgi:hypothetical protein